MFNKNIILVYMLNQTLVNLNQFYYDDLVACIKYIISKLHICYRVKSGIFATVHISAISCIAVYTNYLDVLLFQSDD